MPALRCFQNALANQQFVSLRINEVKGSVRAGECVKRWRPLADCAERSEDQPENTDNQKLPHTQSFVVPEIRTCYIAGFSVLVPGAIPRCFCACASICSTWARLGLLGSALRKAFHAAIAACGSAFPFHSKYPRL